MNLHVKSASFSIDNSRASGLSIFYRISNHKNFIPKYLDNALTDFAETSRTSRRLLEEKAPVNDFWRAVPCPEKYCSSKICNSVISSLWQLRYPLLRNLNVFKKTLSRHYKTLQLAYIWKYFEISKEKG